MNLLLVLTFILGVSHVEDARVPTKYNLNVNETDSIKSINHQKIINRTNRKLTSLNKFIERRNKRNQKKLNSREKKIFEELCKIDETAAEQFYLKPTQRNSYTVKNYQLDTLNILQRYYTENEELTSRNLKSSDTGDLLKKSSDQQASYRNKRKLIELLSEKYPSLAKQNKLYRKEIFYFNQQVGEYGSIIKKTKFISEKDFKKLFKGENLLAFLSKGRLKTDVSKINKGENLQTNESVLTAINEKVEQYNLGEKEIKASVKKLKSHKKVLKYYPNLNNASDIPEFQPNLQKAKRFRDRITYTFDVSNLPEIKKSNNGFTATTGILYKVNNKLETGFGINYNQPVAEVYKLQTPALGPYVIVDHVIKGKFSLSLNYSIHLSELNTNYIGDNIYKRSNNHSFLGGIKIYQNNKRDKIFHSIYYDFFNSKYKTDTLPIVYKVGYKF